MCWVCDPFNNMYGGDVCRTGRILRMKETQLGSGIMFIDEFEVLHVFSYVDVINKISGIVANRRMLKKASVELTLHLPGDLSNLVGIYLTI